MGNVVICKYCKVNPVDVSRSKVACSSCLDIRGEQQNKWASKNRNKINDKSKEYYKSHKKQKSDYDKQYRKKNAEKIRLRLAIWQDKNHDKQCAYGKEYRESHKDELRKTKQKCWYAKHNQYLSKAVEWRKNNLDRSNEILKVSAHKRRANIKGNGGSFTIDEWNNLKSRYNNQCVCCGNITKKLEVDHIVPLVHGGTNNIENIQPLCRSCNAKKHIKTIDYKTRFDMVLEWT